MSASFQFAPMKVYSASKRNVKCIAITEFVKSLLDRQSFDRYNTNREAIVQTVQEECEILNSKLPDIKEKLEAFSESTEEFGRCEDWWLKVRIVAENGRALKVCEIACFYCMGPMNEGAVTYPMGIARSVHTRLGIANINPMERMGVFF